MCLHIGSLILFLVLFFRKLDKFFTVMNDVSVMQQSFDHWTNWKTQKDPKLFSYFFFLSKFLSRLFFVLFFRLIFLSLKIFLKMSKTRQKVYPGAKHQSLCLYVVVLILLFLLICSLWQPTEHFVISWHTCQIFMAQIFNSQILALIWLSAWFIDSAIYWCHCTQLTLSTSFIKVLS